MISTQGEGRQREQEAGRRYENEHGRRLRHAGLRRVRSDGEGEMIASDGLAMAKEEE